LLGAHGVANLVLPQDWLVQPTYKGLRQMLAGQLRIDYLVRLGPGAFQEITGEVVNVLLLGVGRDAATTNHHYAALDCGRRNSYEDKKKTIQTKPFNRIGQAQVISNPGFSVYLVDQVADARFLGEVASSVQGIKSGDDARLTRLFWESGMFDPLWISMQGPVSETVLFGGLERVLDWRGNGELLARKQGLKAWGKRGVAVSQMSDLPCCLYVGAAFDSNVTVIFTERAEDNSAFLNYAFSKELSRSVREFDQSIKPTNSSFEKIQFAVDVWATSGSFQNGAIPKLFQTSVFH
jgi:hypothetical protein